MIRVHRALDQLSSISGAKIMAKNAKYFWNALGD